MQDDNIIRDVEVKDFSWKTKLLIKKLLKEREKAKNDNRTDTNNDSM